MKHKYLLLGMGVSLLCSLASCTKSPEQKVKDLLGKEIKKHLYIPDSYDPAEVKIDSAFAPYDSPEFIKLANTLVENARELAEIQRNIDFSKSSVSIWDDRSSSYSRNEYARAKRDLKKAQDEYSEKIAEGKETAQKFRTMMEQKREFIGYKTYVSYRAKNNDGDILMDAKYALFDKDFENIIEIYESIEYEQYQQALHSIIDSLEE